MFKRSEYLEPTPVFVKMYISRLSLIHYSTVKLQMLYKIPSYVLRYNIGNRTIMLILSQEENCCSLFSINLY